MQPKAKEVRQPLHGDVERYFMSPDELKQYLAKMSAPKLRRPSKVIDWRWPKNRKRKVGD